MDGSRDPCAPAFYVSTTSFAHKRMASPASFVHTRYALYVLYNDNHHMKSQTSYEGHIRDQQIAKFEHKRDIDRNPEWMSSARLRSKRASRALTTCLSCRNVRRGQQIAVSIRRNARHTGDCRAYCKSIFVRVCVLIGTAKRTAMEGFDQLIRKPMACVDVIGSPVIPTISAR
jgi:hypothetical protein